MLVAVNFTLDIPQSELAALREFASAEDNTELAYFLRAEAEECLVRYIEDNVTDKVKIVRRDGRRV